MSNIPASLRSDRPAELPGMGGRLPSDCLAELPGIPMPLTVSRLDDCARPRCGTGPAVPSVRSKEFSIAPPDLDGLQSANQTLSEALNACQDAQDGEVGVVFYAECERRCVGSSRVGRAHCA